jgi:transcriptional regulator with XRE-family HTH domain
MEQPARLRYRYACSAECYIWRLSAQRTDCAILHKFRLTHITNSNNIIAICDKANSMTLGEKIRYMRELEGTLRGLGREMTQLEVVRAIKEEMGESISQSYLSQIESGKRQHLTNNSRLLLARFFKVHPGYLVTDPEGYHAELVSDLRVREDRLDLWLMEGAERFAKDSELRHALSVLAQQEDSRKCLILLHGILETPGLSDRLAEVLSPLYTGKSRVPPVHNKATSHQRRNDQ